MCAKAATGAGHLSLSASLRRALRHLSSLDSAPTHGAAAQGLAASRSSSSRPPRAASSTCGHQHQLLPRRGHHNPQQGNQNTSEAPADADEEAEPDKPSSPSVKKAEEKEIVVVHEAKCKVYAKHDDATKGWKDIGVGQLSIRSSDSFRSSRSWRRCWTSSSRESRRPKVAAVVGSPKSWFSSIRLHSPCRCVMPAGDHRCGAHASYSVLANYGLNQLQHSSRTGEDSDSADFTPKITCRFYSEDHWLR